MSSKYLAVLLLFIHVSGNLSQVYKANNNKDNIIEAVESSSNLETIKNDFITQTVYGFLDFTTTIGNTVMVFSPNSAPPEGEKEKITTGSGIQNKPLTSVEKHVDIQPSKTYKNSQQTTNEKNKSFKNTKIIVNSIVHQNKEETKSPKKLQLTTKSPPPPPPASSVVLVHSQEETAVKNNLAEPEYDYLSKQPTEIVDETYKVISLKPSSKVISKPRPTPKKDKENPTGLVTKLGGTIVKDGVTTIHETSVIGTYINSKYAQVLQSTSRIVKSNHGSNLEGKIRPTSSQKILKTIGPQYGKLKPQLEPTPTNQQQEESSLPLEVLFSSSSGNNGKASRRQSSGFTARTKYKNNKISDDLENNDTPYSPQQPRALKKSSSKLSYKNRVLTTTTTTEAPTRRRSGFKPSNSQQSSSISKSKSDQSFSGLISPKIKLPRGGGRWSYKTTPKPRVIIRKQVDDDEKVSTTENIVTNESSVSTSTFIDDKLALPSSPAQKKSHDGAINNDDELDPSETEQVSSISVQNDQAIVTESSTILPAETINVEISTPAEFNDVYFEIATIKSPYSFQVGSVKNTRYITVTSTIKKAFATVDPTTSSASEQLPLTENILANTGVAYESSLPLDSSVATFPAITLESGQATPPLETLTETFTTTQTLLKTYILPVVSNGNTSRHTLVQTYNIARMVTATKTLPPSELYQFIPSKTLNEFNTKLDEAGSELHLELEFSEDDRDDDDIPKRVVAPNSESLNSDLDIFKGQQKQGNGKLDSPPVSPSPDPNSQLTQEQIQQLALFKYFGQQPGVPQPPQVITTSRPVVVLQTIYESHVIPIVNNGNTIYSTLSRAVGTVPKTSYEYGTSTVAAPPPLINPQIPQLPIFPQQPQYTITSAPIVTQTLATVSDSRVLKLTFGAKTAYTTLYSTKVVPTEVTTYVTTTIPLQQSVPSFPGYFPSPVGYPPYPFVG